MSRQNYYAKRKAREKRDIAEEQVVELVMRERRIHPRIGGRKLIKMLAKEMKKKGIKIGRDKFFDIMRGNELLVKKKVKKKKTTNSYHTLPVFENLVKENKPLKPNEVWVSDITYISTEEGYMYASLITDMMSRKIVGGHIGESLETKESVKALEQAMKALKEGEKPIHHSDRGSQYCSHEYVRLLEDKGCRISMTEKNHCAENAMAERVNGILKQEYELDTEFKTKKQAIRGFKQAVYLYNNLRPHMSLKYKIPSEVHSQDREGKSSTPMGVEVCI